MFTSLLLVSALQLFLPAGAVKPQRPPVTLFKVPRLETPPVRPADQRNMEIVCGLTVIRPDPTIDPKMRVKPPRSHTLFTLRVKTPTVCAR